MRILLTGAAGFIGSAVAAQLRADGHDVVGLDLFIPQAHGPDAAPQTPDVTVGDIRDLALVERLLAGVDVVCHQAAMVGLGVRAQDAPDYASHNVLGTAALLSAMATTGVRQLVLASSMVVYGEGGYRCRRHGETRPGPRDAAALVAGNFDPSCPVCGQPLGWHAVTEAACPDPRNTYAATKLATEHLATAWAGSTGGAVVALRYHNVYGPGMPADTPYAGVASIFRSALAAGRAPLVYEDGRQMRDFVHVDDVARANLAAIGWVSGRPTDGSVAASTRVFNIASGAPHSVGDLAGALAATMNGPRPRVVGGGRPGDVRHIVADPALARAELGFAARISFTAGIAEFATARMRPPATVTTSR